MYNRYSTFVLRWLKVPPEPQPPQGDPASLRVFRAGRNYYKLRMFAWSVTQVIAFAGIVFWAFVFVSVEETARIEKARRAAVAQTAADYQATLKEQANQARASLKAGQQVDPKAKGPAAANGAKKPVRRGRVGGWDGFIQVFVELAIMLPPWAFPILWALKIIGLTLYLVQLPLTYAVRRLDYEMRWYMVTDRSLRIRTGVGNVQEITMSFANLQQVEVSQGPLQRALGLADLKVQSAGGGHVAPGRPQHQDSLHIGYFHGVENATEIRDLIQERLRRFRDSGLGDPEEIGRRVPSPPERGTESAPYPSSSTDADVLAAARELAAEARALRAAQG